MHVDCAFGLVARARDGDFNEQKEGDEMVNMDVHVDVRWGKLMCSALLRAFLYGEGLEEELKEEFMKAEADCEHDSDDSESDDSDSD